MADQFHLGRISDVALNVDFTSVWWRPYKYWQPTAIPHRLSIHASITNVDAVGVFWIEQTNFSELGNGSTATTQIDTVPLYDPVAATWALTKSVSAGVAFQLFVPVGDALMYRVQWDVTSGASTNKLNVRTNPYIEGPIGYP